MIRTKKIIDAGAHRNGKATRNPDLSFVIPLYNEAESLQSLYEGIRKNSVGYRIEMIFIDDGSTDDSLRVLRKLKERDPGGVRVIRFRRNFGKSAALHAGFERARGKLIFTMDADLQDDPAEIPAFLAQMDQGFDLVSGWKKRRHDPWHKTVPSFFFNLMISRLSGLRLHDFNCGFKLFKAEVVQELNLYGELHRFLPVFAHSRGFAVCEMPVKHHARKFGHSKFGLARFYRGFFDTITVTLLTRYLKRPLHFFGSLGIALGGAGFVILSYFLIEKLRGFDIGFRPLFFGGIMLLLAGLQTLTIGLIGEMFVSESRRSDDRYSIREEF